MSKHVRSIPFVLFLSILLVACNLPAAAPVSTEPPAEDAAVVVFTATPTSTAVPDAPIQQCNPIVTSNTVANVRSGPDVVYSIVGNLPQGGTAPVAGKSFDGTWWYIQFPGGNGGFAWIAGSITTATCIPTTLPVIAAPPAPVVVPTNTPVPPVPGEPDPTDVPSPVPGATFVVPPYLLDPPLIFLIPSPTPIPLDFDFDLPSCDGWWCP